MNTTNNNNQGEQGMSNGEKQAAPVAADLTTKQALEVRNLTLDYACLSFQDRMIIDAREVIDTLKNMKTLPIDISGIVSTPVAAALPASNEFEELRKLAMAATPGPWIAAGPSFGAALPKYCNEVLVDRAGDEDDTYTIAQSVSGLDTEPQTTADMAFIAAANPATVLRLIALATPPVQQPGDVRPAPCMGGKTAKELGEEYRAARTTNQQSQQPGECTNPDSWNCKYCAKTATCDALKDPRNFDTPVDLVAPCRALIEYCDANKPMGDSLWCVQQIREALATTRPSAALTDSQCHAIKEAAAINADLWAEGRDVDSTQEEVSGVFVRAILAASSSAVAVPELPEGLHTAFDIVKRLHGTTRADISSDYYQSMAKIFRFVEDALAANVKATLAHVDAVLAAPATPAKGQTK